MILMSNQNSYAGSNNFYPFFQSANSQKNSFIRILTSKSEIYSGESFTASYMLYYTGNIIDPETNLTIKCKDCYQEEFPENKRITEVILNGVLFHVIQLKKLLFTPLGEGSFEIPSISINIKINFPAAADDFFGMEKVSVEKLVSEKKYVHVIPLPKNTSKVNFSGAVGHFIFSSSILRSKESPNKIRYQFFIKGTGNLKSTNWPAPFLPKGMDFMNINNSETDTLMDNSKKVSHTYSFDIVSYYRGNYILSPFAFNYFNTQTKKYEDYQTPTVSWNVVNGLALPDSFKFASPNNINVPFLYIKWKMGNSGISKIYLSKYTYFGFILLTLLLIITPLFTKLWNLSILNATLKSFQHWYAERYALRNVRLLKKSKIIDNNGHLYRELNRVLEQYLCHKTRIEYKFGMDLNIKSIMDKYKVNEEVKIMTNNFLKNQIEINYSPIKQSLDKPDMIYSNFLHLLKILKPFFNE